MAFTEIEKGMAKKTVKQFSSKWSELRYDEIHNKPYFIGKRSKDSADEILFPIDCHKNLTFDDLKTCIVDSGSTAVNLAVYDSDSSVVMYKAELGLKPPKNLIERENDDSFEKRKTADATKEIFVSPMEITEQVEISSTNDDLEIDLHPDDQSESSEYETEDSENSNLDDGTDSVLLQND